MDSFYSEIKAEATDETIIERSKFICLIKKVETEEEAREVLSVVKKNHPFATHNCYAFILRSGAARFSDDGEPQGTAGQPMLEALKNNGLYNVIAVVTRYFGGIKLGAGGLVRAYSGAVSSAIRLAGKIDFYPSDVYGISFNYDAYSHFLKFTQNNPITVLSTDFDQNVKVKIAVKKPSEKTVAAINDLLIGKAEIDKISEGYYAYE